MKKNTIELDQLVDNLSIGVFRQALGVRGKFLFANSVMLTMTGIKVKDFPNTKMSDLFFEKQRYKQLYDKLSCHGYLNNEEAQLTGKNKATIWCSLSCVIANDKKNKPLWIDGFIEDISFKKRIERDLSESKELFKTVFNNSAVAMVVTDKDEKIIAWNPFFEQMLEVSKEQIFNKHLRILFPSKEWRRVGAFKKRKRGIITDLETQLYKSDGSLFDIDMSISVLKDSNNKETGTISIMRDITKQKIAEYKIRESENKTRIILENSPVAITLTDAHERIVVWNKFAEKLLKMNKTELMNLPVHSLYPKEEWKKIRAEDIREKGQKTNFETKIINKEGKVIDIHLSVTVLRDSKGEIIGSVGIMQDITQQKKDHMELINAKKTAEEASTTKSLFLANMSHEVRTPMNTVLGMIDLTLDTKLTEEQKENLVTVKDAADNLLSLLNDILDLSRVEAGKINLEMIEINLHNIVQSVCKGLHVLAKKKDLNLTWNIDPQIPTILAGDPVRVRQVLVNLINNAVKFTFKGNVKVSVKLQNLGENDCEVLFSVLDEGIGIPEDKIDKIFETFSQADDSHTRKYGGTGLGLAISKKLVGMMGGKIWVESENLKGSIFHFTAKFKVFKKVDYKGVAKSIDLDGTKRPSTTEPKEKINILVAEDNIVNQKIAVKLLEKRGWVVKAVDNGQKVLDIIKTEKFDVILMDAQMPVMDGLEATRLIRKEEGKSGKHIPIIALTARAMMEDKKRCLEAGMDGYVAKPIDRLQLYESVETVVKKEKLNG